MSCSQSMKGWKTQMETNHGRKVVRKNRTTRNFWIYTLTVLVIGLLLGVIVWELSHSESEAATYGVYEESIIEEGISREWEADATNFVPLDCSLDVDTQKFVYNLCEAYNIDFTFAMAVMQKESSFKTDVVSDTNDYGLMQINSINHKWLSEKLGITDFLDAEQNVKAGMFILRSLFEEYEEPALVLMAYNLGETAANDLWDKGIYSTNYSDAVLKIQEGFNRKEGTK